MTHSNVREVNHIKSDDLLPLIKVQKIFPFGYIRNIEREQFVNYLNHEIQGVLNKDAIPFIYEENNIIRGILILQLLKWDTEIFGFPCARIRFLLSDESEESQRIKFELVSYLIKWAKGKKIQFIDIHISPMDLNGVYALTENHFRLIATHIHHVWDFRKDFILLREPQTPIRIATMNDLPNIKKFAELFIPKHNRFFMDDKLRSTNKIPFMFQEWLTHSLLGRADCFLIAEMNNQIVGYTTLVVEKETKKTLGITIADVELTGVIPDNQNRGVLLDMINFSVHWVQKSGYDIMTGMVHVCNAPANIVPPKLQSRILGAHHTFHWHTE